MIEAALESLAGKVLATHPQGTGPPIVSWILTRRCNMRCAHCYTTSGSGSGDAELGFDEQADAVRKLSASGVRGVFLSGGEPLLLPRLFDLIGLLRARAIQTWLCTNGGLIDEDVARRIAKAGVEAVSVSLDSPDDLVHDEFRGFPGAWSKALRAVRLLRRAGVPVDVECTVTRLNRRDLVGLHALVSDLGARALGMKRFRPVGRGGENAHVLDLNLDAYREALVRLAAEARTSGAEIHVDDPAFCVYHRRLGPCTGLTPTNGWHATFGCLAARVWIGLQPNGDLTPCPLLNVVIGNIVRDDIAEALDRSALVRRLRNRDDRGGRCGMCESRPDCGGCRAHAHVASGDPLAEDPFCVQRCNQGAPA